MTEEPPPDRPRPTTVRAVLVLPVLVLPVLVLVTACGAVTLTLDGRTHTATAVYPDDEIEGNEPSVPLRFDPPLPR